MDVTRGLILWLVALIVDNIWLRQRRKQEAARRAEALEVERLVQAQHLDALLDASPTEFGHIVANLLIAAGFVILSAGNGEGDPGADIVWQHPENRRVVVQCKRYAPGNGITSPNMQPFIGMAHRTTELRSST
jgi:restriction system protein